MENEKTNLTKSSIPWDAIPKPVPLEAIRELNATIGVQLNAALNALRQNQESVARLICENLGINENTDPEDSRWDSTRKSFQAWRELQKEVDEETAITSLPNRY